MADVQREGFVRAWLEWVIVAAAVAVADSDAASVFSIGKGREGKERAD